MKWIDRIKRAKKRGKFTEVDKDLMGDFNTCMVGETFNYKKQWDIRTYLRNKAMSKYKVNKIYELALDSVNAVCNDKIKEAQQIYDEIQKLKV